MLDANLILAAASKQKGWRYCNLVIKNWRSDPVTDAVKTTSSNGLTFTIFSYTPDARFNAITLEDEHGTLFYESCLKARDINSKINRVYMACIEEIEINAKSKLEQLALETNRGDGK